MNPRILINRKNKKMQLALIKQQKGGKTDIFIIQTYPIIKL
jgi:hypothetical protein